MGDNAVVIGKGGKKETPNLHDFLVKNMFGANYFVKIGYSTNL